MAALIFKNSIIIENQITSDSVESEIWFNLEEQMRQDIKEAFLEILGSSQEENQLKIAAMCLAVVARVELP